MKNLFFLTLVNIFITAHIVAASPTVQCDFITFNDKTETFETMSFKAVKGPANSVQFGGYTLTTQISQMCAQDLSDAGLGFSDLGGSSLHCSEFYDVHAVISSDSASAATTISVEEKSVDDLYLVLESNNVSASLLCFINM